MESIDKAIYGMVSKSSGRNESERIGYLETQKTQRPNLTCRGEGNMDRRRLTGAARRSGAAVATARGQSSRCVAGVGSFICPMVRCDDDADPNSKLRPSSFLSMA